MRFSRDPSLAIYFAITIYILHASLKGDKTSGHKGNLNYANSEMPESYAAKKLITLNREEETLHDVGRRLCNTESEECYSFLKNKSVQEIALIAETDEFWSLIDNRYYYDAYETLIPDSMRSEKFTLIEFGIYEGHSLWLWKHFFPNARIVGVDYKRRPGLEKLADIEILINDYTDTRFLKELCNKYSDIRLIIDDATHVPENSLQAFKTMFPCMLNNSYYVIEDLYGYYNISPSNPLRKLKFYKDIIDGINELRFFDRAERVDHLSKQVFGLHFYSNLLFIEKKESRRLVSFPVAERKRRELEQKLKQT